MLPNASRIQTTARISDDVKQQGTTVMPQGQKQQRNPELVRNLTTDFLTNERFFWDGARLLSAILATHAAGGGDLRWGWMADSPALFGRANANNQHLTENNITAADYFATGYGGPYVDFNGTNEYLSAGDRTWAEIGAEEALIWMWCNADTLAANDRIICSKWGAGAGHRQWHLYWDVGNGAFQFEVSVDGTAISAVTSTYMEAISNWYLVAGYFEPSAADGLRIFVGNATDNDVTEDTAAAPASVFTGGMSAFEIGSENVGNNLWDGRIGIGNMRLNVPSTNITAYVRRLFGMTKEIYQ